MISENLRLGQYLIFITDENKSTKFASIEKRKNSRVSGAQRLSFIGHVSESDFSRTGSVFAQRFLGNLSSDEYMKLRDKVLTYSYKLPPLRYIHAMVYRVEQ